MKTFATLALLAALPLLAACGRDPAPEPTTADQAADAAAPRTALGRTVARALDEARKELREGDLSLDHGYDVTVNGKRVHSKPDDSLPKAAITPRGELVVAGRTVPMDEDARALALAYREALIGVAEAGMDLGVRGADLGMHAAREAIGSLFSGDREGLEARIEAEARKLEAGALKLCERLPGLLDTQRALATAVPEFAPYARLTVEDIEDCREQAQDHGDSAVANERTNDRDLDPAAEADAAAATDAAALANAASAAASDPGPADPTR